MHLGFKVMLAESSSMQNCGKKVKAVSDKGKMLARERGVHKLLVFEEVHFNNNEHHLSK